MEEESVSKKGKRKINQSGTPTFLKEKRGKDEVDPELLAEHKKSRPIFDKQFEVWFVNGAKYRRAQNILALIKGTKAPVKSDDVERKDHYAGILAANEVDLESDEALPALYEILGGLIRTSAQQKQAEANAEEARRKGKKRMVEEMR